MAELLQAYAEVVRDARGEEFAAEAHGEEREDGKWEGWLVFRSAAGEVRRTGRETTQPDHEALVYWASGLEPVYLDGALGRAS
ncbi:MAG TPA: hypothetical protein VF508_07130 [Pyrinomonadaceae bacterium]|jgi:hypothetical protein